MKIAVTHNTDQGQFFIEGERASNERLPVQQTHRVMSALRKAGHEVEAIEADVHVIDRLRSFFDTERNNEWPGIVFNLAYGLQGQARYCHLPSILEMMGIPYVGSDPLGHALAYDKLTAKRLFRSLRLATPAFTVYEKNGQEGQSDEGETSLLLPDAKHRFVVKPVAEAVSEGLELVSDREELNEAVDRDLKEFGGPVIAEEFMSGREINVSLIGNDPVETLPPVEVIVEGSPLFDAETKLGKGASFYLECPARLPMETRQKARDLAVRAFALLRCRDWARVDLRLDEEGEPHILEVNTIPGFSPSSSFFKAATQAGFQDMDELVLHLLDTAIRRYQENPAQLV